MTEFTVVVGVFAACVGLLVVGCFTTCIQAQRTLQRCMDILDDILDSINQQEELHHEGTE